MLGKNQICDTHQRKKQSIKNTVFLDKLADETAWNKYVYDSVVLYKICRKVRVHLIIISVTIINSIMCWFEIMKHENKTSMKILNIVKTTRIFRHPWPIEIIYYQGS